MLVSKDDDFRQLILLRGVPPKVLVLAVRNGGNAAVLDVLTSNRSRIEAFDTDAQESLLDTKAANWSKKANSCTFNGIPVYDAPILIADRSSMVTFAPDK